MTTQTTLLIIPKSNMIRVHASIEEYKGKQRFDIRTYYLAGAEWLPTQKGVVIDMEQVPLLIEALQKVQAQLNEGDSVKTITQKICTALLVSLLATCSTSPSYADQENVLTATAKTSNNGRQERKKLPVTVKHHTIVDVFFCLPFISLPFMGELRLAIAFIALWWGGDGNKPCIGRIPSAVLQRFLTLPAALYLGQIIKKTPVRKVL